MVAGSKTGLLSWVYTDDGTLIISGEGEMPSYNDNAPQPWIYHRYGIKSVIIEDGVTTIGDSAFIYCAGLTSITIPNSVTTIQVGAFENCENLTDVTIMAKMPPAINSTRNFMANNDTLYVPVGCADAYRNSIWGELFTTITEH
jgi:hypothetical protein